MKVEYEVQPGIMTVTLDKQDKSAQLNYIDMGVIQPVSLDTLRSFLPTWREVAKEQYNLNIESIDALAIDLKEIEDADDQDSHPSSVCEL